MPKVVGISGSLRKGSFNTSLLRAAVEAAPAGMSIDQRTIHGIPLYDGDLEAESGIPVPVRDLKDQIAAADALLLVTPEYNNGIPGPFKNAIDWLSRPPKDIPRVFANKPVAVMGASPGRAGTVLSQNAWLPVLKTLGTCLWSGGRLMVGGASKVFDASGNLVDDEVREQLKKFMTGFGEFVARASR